ncbi:MAG: hypothetical protein C4288_04490 [Leptolyngbya sp. ERB_1_1]
MSFDRIPVSTKSTIDNTKIALVVRKIELVVRNVAIFRRESKDYLEQLRLSLGTSRFFQLSA